MGLRYLLSGVCLTIDIFRRICYSFGIRRKLRKINCMTGRYTMRGIPSLITDIRKKVFTEVARMAYEGGDYTKAEDLP